MKNNIERQKGVSRDTIFNSIKISSADVRKKAQTPSDQLISKDGIGPIKFTTKFNRINSSKYLKLEKGESTDESEEPYQWMRVALDTNKVIFILAEINNSIYEIATMSSYFKTQQGISVGDTFEKLVSVYPEIEIIYADDGGDGVLCYWRKGNITFQLPQLDFKEQFDYSNTELTKQPGMLLTNVIDKTVKINSIDVRSYITPKRN
jgi:hypothetical protein